MQTRGGKVGLALAGLLFAAATGVAIASVGYAEGQAFSGFLVILTIWMWATQTIPAHVTALLFMAVAVMLPVGGPEIAFAGFLTSAFWLVFGGLVMGSAIEKSGLGNRMARQAVSLLPQTYLGLVSVIVACGVALAFFVPSAMARVVILLPLVSLITGQLIFDNARGRTGLQLAAIIGTTLPGFSILTGNLPTILAYGAFERLFSIVPGYLSFLLAQFPPIGLAQSFLIIAIVHLFFRTGLTRSPSKITLEPMSRSEWIVLAIIAGALVLWMTDHWHGIAPGWIALCGAAFCLMPWVSVFGADDFNKGIEHRAVTFTAGIIALVAFVAASGLNDVLTDLATAVLVLDPDTPFANYAQLTMASAIVGLVGTHPSVAATLIPISDVMALSAGLTQQTTMLMLTGAFPLVIAPYQVAPLAVGIAIARISAGNATKALATISLATAILLLPLHFLWLGLIGYR